MDRSPEEPRTLLTLDEVAKLLRLSPKTVKRMAAEGTIPPSVRVGRGLRWFEEEVFTFLHALPRHRGR